MKDTKVEAYVEERRMMDRDSGMEIPWEELKSLKKISFNDLSHYEPVEIKDKIPLERIKFDDKIMNIEFVGGDRYLILEFEKHKNLLIRLEKRKFYGRKGHYSIIEFINRDEVMESI